MELNISIMKRLYRYILAVAAIAAAASCAKNIAPENPAADNVTIPENLEPMVFASSLDDSMQVPGGQPAASVASRTTYASRTVYWEDADKISVFSIGETEVVKTEFGVKTLSDDRLTATFQGLADSQASAFCAVYPHNDKNAYENGTLTVNIPSEQTAVAEGFASGANVSVAYSANNGETVLQFKNATTLLCIKFADQNDADKTSRITFRAKKNETEYWGLCGQAQLTLGAENVPVVSEGDEQQVTLLAPADGFVKDAIYYVPVYAVGECAGFEVTFTDLNGDPYTKTKNVPGSLDRNWLFNFSSIPCPYPETFTVTLDFATAWPFNTSCVAADVQNIYATNVVDNTITEETAYWGETYIHTCTYQSQGITISRDLEFKINKGRVDTNSYSYANSALTFTGSEKNNMGGAIILPGIEGYYLTNVTAKKKGNSGRLTLVNPMTGNTNTAFYQGTGADKTYTFNLYADKLVSAAGTNGNSYTGIKATSGRIFELRCRDANMTISKITLTYSNVKPGNAPTE